MAKLFDENLRTLFRMLPTPRREPKPLTAMRESWSLDELRVVFSTRTFQRGLGLFILLIGTAVASFYAHSGWAAWMVRADFALAGLVVALYCRTIQIDLENGTFVRREGVDYLRSPDPKSLPSSVRAIEVRRESPGLLLFTKSERYVISLVFRGEGPPFELTAFPAGDNPRAQSVALEEAKRLGGSLNLPVEDYSNLGVLTSSAQPDILSLTFDFRPGYVSWRKQDFNPSLSVFGLIALIVVGLNAIRYTMPATLPILAFAALIRIFMQARGGARWIYVADRVISIGVVVNGDNLAKKRIPLETIVRIRYVSSTTVSSASVWMDTRAGLIKVGDNLSDNDAVWLTNWLQAQIREDLGLLP